MLNWRQRVIVIVLAILVGIGIGYVQVKNQKVVVHEGETADTASPLAGVALGGPFTLVNQNGKRVTDKSWPDQYLLVYFGFTHCPDICPVGLTKIADAMNALPKDKAAKVQPLFITIDPERDSAKSLKDYVVLFHPKLIGLTGTQRQIDIVVKNFRVYAQKQIIDGDTKNYMMNHSSYAYLVAPDGKVADVYAHEATAAEIAAKIEKHVQ